MNPMDTTDTTDIVLHLVGRAYMEVDMEVDMPGNTQGTPGRVVQRMVATRIHAGRGAGQEVRREGEGGREAAACRMTKLSRAVVVLKKAGDSTRMLAILLSMAAVMARAASTRARMARLEVRRGAGEMAGGTLRVMRDRTLIDHSNSSNSSSRNSSGGHAGQEGMGRAV